ncbi:MAG: AmmeMemoRadiSam system protein A [Vicinamibacterales bacterium]
MTAKAQGADGPLPADDRRRMLDEARAAVADALAGRPVRHIAPEGVFASRAGVFVSLHLDGELRGCIGHPAGDRPLASVIPECAVAAATGDPRFDAISPAELPRCVIEISVLGPIITVRDPGEIIVGRDGLIAEQGWRRGLLLPQVAVEHGWDREAFLSRTCGKAGLPPDAWKRGAAISRFEAEVFDDADAAWRHE